MRPRHIAAAVAALLSLLLPVITIADTVPVQGTTADVVTAAREYRATLERLLPFNENDLARATATLEKRRSLVERGIVSRREVEEAETAQASARTKLDQTRGQIQQADTLIAEALAAEELRRRPPARDPDLNAPGPAPAFTYFDGRRVWSLALTPRIEAFFEGRFGRPLPVSAFGQTAVHDRLGFDHRNAVDIALHPDSVEGRALIAYLRSASISYLAFRGAVPGAATGAHIHIGPASPRVAHVTPDHHDAVTAAYVHATPASAPPRR
jgi:hypothetical protein